MSYNKAQLIGRLGSKPELKYTTQGKAFCHFSLATHKIVDTNGEKKQFTEWHNIAVWGKWAEVCDLYLQKGSEIFVEGELRTSSYEKNKVKCYKTEVYVNLIRFLRDTKKNNLEESKENQVKDYKPEPQKEFAYDEIPF